MPEGVWGENISGGVLAYVWEVLYNKYEKKAGDCMDVQVGDILQMKKAHPCGGNMFSVKRVGMDFRIHCDTCGHEVMVPRAKVEKNIKKIFRGGVEVEKNPPKPSKTTG